MICGLVISPAKNETVNLVPGGMNFVGKFLVTSLGIVISTMLEEL
jgi:hypothetical protein